MSVPAAAFAAGALAAVFVVGRYLLPAILGYTVFAYRVFWGKTRELSYD